MPLPGTIVNYNNIAYEVLSVSRGGRWVWVRSLQSGEISHISSDFFRPNSDKQLEFDFEP